MSLAGATQDEVRRHNLAALVRFLHDHGSTSRSELVSHTGLNRSTVGGLLSDLVAADLVRETEPVGRGVGRPSYGVEPMGDSAYVLAIESSVPQRGTAFNVGSGVTLTIKALADSDRKFTELTGEHKATLESEMQAAVAGGADIVFLALPHGVATEFALEEGRGRTPDALPGMMTAEDVAFTYNYIIDNELTAYTSSTVRAPAASAPMRPARAPSSTKGSWM